MKVSTARDQEQNKKGAPLQNRSIHRKRKREKESGQFRTDWMVGKGLLTCNSRCALGTTGVVRWPFVVLELDGFTAQCIVSGVQAR